MRLKLLAAVVPLITQAAAGGYHGCLERVALWQAYTLEGQSEIKPRTIGFHCPEFRHGTGCPEDGWKMCGVAGQRCSFVQLMKQMNPNVYTEPPDWLVVEPQRGNRIDTKATATKCYEYFRTHGLEVPDFVPENVMKVANSKFSDYVEQLSRRVDTIWGSLMPMKRVGQKQDFEAFTDTYEKAAAIRNGDIGNKLVEQARLILEPGIHVEVTSLGKHPLFGHDMETVDWIKTEAGAEAAGVEDYKGRIERFKADYFAEGTEAANHRNITKRYAAAATNRKKCGRK